MRPLPTLLYPGGFLLMHCTWNHYLKQRVYAPSKFAVTYLLKFVVLTKKFEEGQELHYLENLV
jgi:hypothetical protein